MDERDPDLREMEDRLTVFMQQHGLRPASPPKYRYFQRRRGHMYCWTTEPANHDVCSPCAGNGVVIGDQTIETCAKCNGSGLGRGWYASFVYRAKGTGSRSGKAARWELDERSQVKHRKRKDAKARALKLYRADMPDG